MGWGHSASLQFSVVRPSNELELTQKNWIEGNQKFIFQTQLDKRVWLSLVIELSGAHKRKQVWNKIECSNFEPLMAGTLLTTACPKGKLEFTFFASPDHHLILFFKIIVWALNSQKCFVFNCSIAELHQTLLFGRVQYYWDQFDGNFIRFCLVWYAMLYTEPSLIAVLWL